MGGLPLNRPVVGIAADTTTGGNWEVATDGGMIAFGALFYGSTGNLVLNEPINGRGDSVQPRLPLRRLGRRSLRRTERAEPELHRSAPAGHHDRPIASP